MDDDDILDADSNDSDIFVVKHIKPQQKKILTTNGINPLRNDKSANKISTGKVGKQSDALHERKPRKRKNGSSFSKETRKKTKTTGSENKKKYSCDIRNFISPTKVTDSNSKQSSPKNYIPSVSSQNSSNLKTDKSPEKVSNSPDKSNNYKLSPGIKSRRQNFKIYDKEPRKKKTVKKSLFQSFDETKEKEDENLISLKDNETSLKNEIKFEDDSLFDEFQSSFLLTEFDVAQEKQVGNSAVFCFSLKKIIKDERKKQDDLQKLNLNGLTVEKLLLDFECEIYEKFFNLEENACKVFVRMLGRKKSWHRVSTIKYSDIGETLNTEFELLKKINFVDTKIEEEDLKTQMELLSKPEVLNFCKEFNVSLKSSNKYKKEDLINCLIEDSKKQRSVHDIFGGKNSTSRLDRIKNKINKSLGLCVRLNNKVFRAFYKILVLFSFPHFSGEENQRFQEELFLYYQVHKNLIKFPNYSVSPTVVFERLEDFQEYENSLLLQDFFEVAINNTNLEDFSNAYKKAKIEFEKLSNNKEYIQRFLNLKPFLRKFSAGTVYARILTEYCKTFKRQVDDSEVIKTTELLLGQNIFLVGKKGEWYEILVKALENQKENDRAAEVLINGLKDPSISEVQKLTLQLRGQLILKKKTWGMKDVKLKEVLEDMCTSTVREPLSTEIKGKAVEGNEPGFKSVFVQEFENTKVYTSVEERAITHYRSNGYTKGYHVEGVIVQSLYYLFLYDIIYDSSVEGVFLSPYQEAPLDFYSSSFYQNRKKAIDQLLNDMLSWNDEEIMLKISDSYKNYQTVCVIQWREEFTPELFCEVIKCISMPKLVLIFQRFIKNLRVSRSGFPDLTLWNPETNQCKFVEVKGPSDKLSPAQRIWLDYLSSIGLDCEVCNIKNK